MLVKYLYAVMLFSCLKGCISNETTIINWLNLRHSFTTSLALEQELYSLVLVLPACVVHLNSNGFSETDILFLVLVDSTGSGVVVSRALDRHLLPSPAS